MLDLEMTMVLMSQAISYEVEMCRGDGESERYIDGLVNGVAIVMSQTIYINTHIGVSPAQVKDIMKLDDCNISNQDRIEMFRKLLDAGIQYDSYQDWMR